MKKNLFTIAIIGLLFSGCDKEKDPTNDDPKEFDLGTVSFATSQTWVVGNQTWSDAVTATGCNKTNLKTVSRGDTFVQLADCRSNPDFPGDLFSWMAVNQFRNKLCPTPWRVPTASDFRNLDIALGGTGGYFISKSHAEKYISVWGGAFGGCANEIGNLLEGQAYYWSQSVEDKEISGNVGLPLVLYFNSALGEPQSAVGGYGTVHAYTLRCVR
jgi:uncharacterized protein (TIGR02145 family)